MNLKDYEYYSTDLGTLYCGDCLEIMPLLPKVDLVLTDPPYGCKATTGRGGKYDGFKIKGDADTTARDKMLSMVNGASIIVFGSPRIQRPTCKAVLVWWKGEHTGMGDLSFPWKPDFEEIYISGDIFNGKRTSSVLRHNARTDSARHHPTEKPIPLILDLLKKSPAQTTFDPFAGSGTTAVACERLRRRWICIEISEEYCAIAKRRIELERQQLKLF